MASQSNTVERERDLLERCIGEAYEALRVLPGVDAKGPALVRLAEQFRAAYRQAECPPEDR
jgi:hypothetical protein